MKVKLSAEKNDLNLARSPKAKTAASMLIKLLIARKRVMNPEQRRRAFTLIELLVVITIIAILSTITYVVYINAQAKARDSKRRADVQTIANALQVYHIETKSWLVQGPPPENAGTGYVSEFGSTGTGWFNKVGDGTPFGYSPKSIAAALVERKFLIEELKDPNMTLGDDQMGNPLGQRFQYMVYECPDEISGGGGLSPLNRAGLSVYALLEHPSLDDQAAITEEYNRPVSVRCDVINPVDNNSMSFMVKVN